MYTLSSAGCRAVVNNAQPTQSLNASVNVQLATRMEMQGLQEGNLEQSDLAVSLLAKMQHARSVPGYQLMHVPVAKPLASYWEQDARFDTTFSGVLAIEANSHTLMILTRALSDAIIQRNMTSPLQVMSRFIPRSGGGILANNALHSQVTFETYGLGRDQAERLWWPLLNKLSDAGIRCHWHTGKDFMRHPACRERLQTEQRMAFSAVMRKFDPLRLFDGGRVKLSDMVSLDL